MLYIHIPFCLKRCAYCDFYSQTDERQMDHYVEALCDEMAMRCSEIDPCLRSIYIGGGTPSQLRAEHIQRLFAAIAQHFDLSRCEEITFEANPDDLTLPYIAMLRTTPINRLSMGIQSMDDADLRLLTRRHTALQAKEAVWNCYHAGFRRISIDLIYALPAQTVEQWGENLRQALALPIDHLSAYHLTYEEGTVLWRRLQRGDISEVDESTSVEMFYLLRQETERVGMTHYEISNFCLPDCHARHNSSYWRGVPYLGIGASAHSYDGHCRSVTMADVSQYIATVQRGELPVEREMLSPIDQYNDYIITRLRTQWGVVLAEIENHYGTSLATYFTEQLDPYVTSGDVIHREGSFVLSPAGMLRSDGIMEALIWCDR